MVKQTINEIISDMVKSEVEKRLKELDEELFLLQSSIDDLSISALDMSEKIQDTQADTIMLMCSVIPQILALSVDDFCKWANSQANKIAIRENVPSSVIFRRVYSKIPKTSANRIDYNFSFYGGTSKLKMIAELKNSENPYEHLVRCDFVKTLLKMAA